MANFEKYFPKLVEWEGSAFENVPGDKGGPTKYGVILSEWKAKGWDKNGDGKIDVEDLKLISANDAMSIVKSHYWDVLKADQINNQSIAEMLVDFAYTSGVTTSARKLQEVLGTVADGIIGPNTLNKINTSDPQKTFDNFKQKRINFYKAIAENNPSQNKFLKGWLNRANSFKFLQ